MKKPIKNKLTRFLTNRQFAERDKSFRNFCKIADTPPTIRQASKFRMGRGLAFSIKKLRTREDRP